MSARPEIVFVGDDFTGATDTLATAAEAGWRSLLFLRVPDAARLAQAGPLDVVGVALATRSQSPADIAAELAPVAALARRLDPRVLHYKVCSTFDSAPQVGSIGAAVRALAPAVDVPWTAIVGGQPSLGRHAAFGHLFARAAAGEPALRIDRHPTMARHPVTPMAESDLRRHLAAQGLADIALVPVTALGDDASAVDALQRALPAAAVLFDVVDDAQLARIGRLLDGAADGGRLLAVGASSVVQALAAARAASADPIGSAVPAGVGIARTDARADPAGDQGGRHRLAPAVAPVLAIAGSRSPATAAQVLAAHAYERLPLTASALLAEGGLEAAADAVAARLRAGNHVVAFVEPPAADAPPLAPQAVAQATAHLLAVILARIPLPRIAVLGGDTASLAVRALDAWALEHAGRLAPGVAFCRLRSDDPRLDGTELALKGGQMGDPGLLDRLVFGDPA